MDIYKISFFVNINLNKSYCKDCIIYMAHVVLDLSLSLLFFFLFHRLQIPAPRISRATCGPCVSRRHTCAPIHNPIRSTSSLAVSIQRVIVDPNPLRVSRSRRGESHNAALPYDNIATHAQNLHVSHFTCTKMHLHLHRAIIAISCLWNYLKTLQYSFCCCNLMLSIHQGRWRKLS